MGSFEKSVRKKDRTKSRRKEMLLDIMTPRAQGGSETGVRLEAMKKEATWK